LETNVNVENSVNTNQSSSGKLIQIIFGLIIIALILVIIFLVSQPQISDLKPPKGDTDYFLSVNAKGELLPYTADGRAWLPCGKNKCLSIDRIYQNQPVSKGINTGFYLVKGSTDDYKLVANTKFSYVNVAHAQSEKDCPIIGYRPIGSSGKFKTVYHPDCR